jgi:hypothetical protein
MMFWNRIGVAVAGTVCLVLAGGAAGPESDGEASVFTNTWGDAVVLLGLIGLIGGFGVYRVCRGIQKVRVKRKTSTGVRRIVKTEVDYSQVGVGGALIVGGLVTLFLGVPSSLLAYMKVTPTQLEIRDGLFWFLDSPRTIPFDELTGLQVKEVEQRRRWGRRTTVEYLVIQKTGGSKDEMQMGRIHRKALPALMEALEAHDREQMVGGGTVPSSPPIPSWISERGKPPRADGSSGTETTSSAAVDPSPSAEATTQEQATGDAETAASLESPPADPETPTTGTAPATPRSPSERPSPGVPQTQPVPPTPRTPPDLPLTRIDRFGPFESGLKVRLRQEEGWVPAVVVEVYNHGRLKLKWEEGMEEREEIVSLSQVTPDPEALRARRNAQQRDGSGGSSIGRPVVVESPGQPIGPNAPLEQGTKVVYQFGRQWRLAEVIETDPQRGVRIHTTGLPDNFNRWIGRERLRFAPED